MELREFFSEDAIKLELEGNTKDDVLKELIALLGLDEKAEGMLYKMLKRRENLGSTGIGRGIAIPHCRSLVVNKLRVAFGRKSNGMDFKAIDEKPVNFFFLIVAPAFRSAPSFFTVLYQSSTIGIVAVGVGMLMIGGEFDLSAGVLVTAGGLFNALVCYNLGLNQGRIAGAGMADHVHLHVVPRWAGDTNFMPVVSDTRVLPQSLADSQKAVREAFLALDD